MVEFVNKELDALFHALAHRTRRDILMLLATRPHHLSELTSKFEISLTAISRHVQVLHVAGLVHRRFVGRNHMCSLKLEALDALIGWTKSLTGAQRNHAIKLEEQDRSRPIPSRSPNSPSRRRALRQS
ncbi:ArsR/SmtB family transcription factor [Hyphomicrobium sp.]|uniref:ArsR/SmtB family transcription factor n=1 Tax=Hyphomicrobium sp. TaxID=82 RepID=UPI0039C88105